MKWRTVGLIPQDLSVRSNATRRPGLIVGMGFAPMLLVDVRIPACCVPEMRARCGNVLTPRTGYACRIPLLNQKERLPDHTYEDV